MTATVLWPEQVKRLAEVREKDKSDETIFLTSLREKHEEAQKSLTRQHQDIIHTWEAQMERLIVIDNDRAWLQFLVGEYQGASRRNLASFKAWLDKIYHTDSSNYHKDMERTLSDATKKFVAGINSADRLEALIFERHAILFRQRIDHLCRRDESIRESISNNLTSMTQTQEMFTRLFQRAIA